MPSNNDVRACTFHQMFRATKYRHLHVLWGCSEPGKPSKCPPLNVALNICALLHGVTALEYDKLLLRPRKINC